MEVQLFNVIELLPFDFAMEDYISPKKPSSEVPELWNDYWKKCLKDSNLGKLDAIKKGSYFVDINKINQSELEIIIKNQLKDIDLEEYNEQLMALSGGIMIEQNSGFLIEPMCCGSLLDLQEWEFIKDAPKNEWQQLWIGHPWLFYQTNGTNINFTDYLEENVQAQKEYSIKYQFKKDTLLPKIEEKRQELVNFEKRIRQILEKIDIKPSREIAQILSGNING